MRSRGGWVPMLWFVVGCAAARPPLAAPPAAPPPAAPPPAAPPPAAPLPAAPPPAAPTAFDALPGWRDDPVDEALPAWRRTCERLARAPDARPVGPGGLAGTAADWRPACRALSAVGTDADAARAYFQRWFVPVPVASDPSDRGLFTGYYEPELHGSRTRSGRYRVPLYGRPTDLVSASARHGVGRRVRGRLRPYFTRAQIVAGALRRTARPLLWVDDPIEAFFLEIQGSGRVVLDDGARCRFSTIRATARPTSPSGAS